MLDKLDALFSDISTYGIIMQEFFIIVAELNHFYKQQLTIIIYAKKPKMTSYDINFGLH